MLKIPTLVHNMDSALESVETILGAVLDISRLDTGAMKPRLATVALDDLLKRIETDYPAAGARKGPGAEGGAHTA